MKDADDLLREFVNLAVSPQTDRYLEQLAQTDATAEGLATLLKRLEQKIQRLEAVNVHSSRDIAQEIFALTRAVGKSRTTEVGPLTGWGKLDFYGQPVSLDNETWSVAFDRGHRLMWTVNAEQSGDEPHPCRQVRWSEALATLTQLNTHAWCGHRDWRIPSIEELATLAYTADGSSAYQLSGTLFPDLRGDGVYWSSTRFEDTRLLQVLSFADASRDARQAGVHSYLRLVRSVSDDEL